MLSSEEVRWFVPGDIPPEVLTWVAQGERKPVRQKPRVDRYLRLTENSLGVKLREGRLELKQRQDQSGVVHVLDRVTGIIEGWCKWGFVLSESDDESTKLAPPTWITVSKERWLRKYRLTDSHEVSAASVEDYVERGGHLELTRIGLEDEQWWTLGFEVFGAAPSSREDLLRVLDHVFRLTPAPMVFHAKDSYGYPKWLEGLASR